MEHVVPDELECPSCGRVHPGSERFCKDCGMPLVHPARTEADVGERGRRARKVDARYTEGPAVKVAYAKDLAQAEFLAGLLLEEGIPSMVYPPGAGPYAPLMGMRAVLVPESGADAAKELLAYEQRRSSPG